MADEEQSKFDRAVDTILGVVRPLDEGIDDIRELLDAVDAAQLDEENQARLVKARELAAKGDEWGDRAIERLEQAKGLDDRARGVIEKIVTFFQERKAARQAKREGE